ncbi:hypothetical protein ZWY2020_029123 [Hordeum vulgare]|nr:hypothetical protein ZWY2020_029123 [Hordeum vulgare]
MSSRRSSRGAISDEEINELISSSSLCSPTLAAAAPASLTCTKRAEITDAWNENAGVDDEAAQGDVQLHQSLHREVDDLNDRLSDLMSTMDHNSAGAEIIRSILRS